MRDAEFLLVQREEVRPRDGGRGRDAQLPREGGETLCVDGHPRLLDADRWAREQLKGVAPLRAGRRR